MTDTEAFAPQGRLSCVYVISGAYWQYVNKTNEVTGPERLRFLHVKAQTRILDY